MGYRWCCIRRPLDPKGPLPTSSVVWPSYFQSLIHAIEGASHTCQILKRRTFPHGAHCDLFPVFVSTNPGLTELGLIITVQGSKSICFSTAMYVRDSQKPWDCSVSKNNPHPLTHVLKYYVACSLLPAGPSSGDTAPQPQHIFCKSKCLSAPALGKGVRHSWQPVTWKGPSPISKYVCLEASDVAGSVTPAATCNWAWCVNTLAEEGWTSMLKDWG